jgi:hypothetical protein
MERPVKWWLIGSRRVGERLEVNSVAEIFKRVAAFVGMDSKEVEVSVGTRYG